MEDLRARKGSIGRNIPTRTRQPRSNIEHGRNWPTASSFTIYTMKLLDIQAAIGTAILLLSSPCDAKHSHRLQHLEVMGRRHDHQRIHASPRAEGIESGLQKRGTCEFPSDAGLVAVTPGSSNGGWAMSPDQPCTAGSYCPFACPPGQVMAQWNPQATSYTYPQSMVCMTSRIKNRANLSRMVVAIATRVVKPANLSQINRTVWMGRELSRQ